MGVHQSDGRKNRDAGTNPGHRGSELESTAMNDFYKRQNPHKLFRDKENAIIFSCGSGITACILALGAHIIGYSNISVYDGSWTEWGSLVKE